VALYQAEPRLDDFSILLYFVSFVNFFFCFFLETFSLEAVLEKRTENAVSDISGLSDRGDKI
ncbi:MAG: hypothetical protein UCN50_12065, partial [Anaerotignum sp.]|uniref:hypothetical protein n=1 Tax=Anaerotignum sp. TaxID=2039241 RepID=UPI002E77C95F